MSKTKKYYFYLNTDKYEQAMTIAHLDQLAQGKRSEMIKNVILSGFSLKKIDERLPLLVSSLLLKPTSLSTLANIIAAISPDYDISKVNNSKESEIVAWQKRIRDPLLPDNRWSAWISITELEYSSLISKNNTNTQVRGLIGAINGDFVNDTAYKKSLLSEVKPMTSSTQNLVINKANKLFNT
ncbi:MAG: plasmid partitioning/stability family protein [Arsenophonus sp. NEOnobi-MAG3]